MIKATKRHIVISILCIMAMSASLFAPAFAFAEDATESAGGDIEAEQQVTNEDQNEEQKKNGEYIVYSAGDFYAAVSGDKKKKIIIKKNIRIKQTYIGSNTTIVATGRTIKCGSGALRNTPKKVNYGSAQNISIVGGTWNSSFNRSLFQFVHAKNISMKNMTITCGVKGHAIELIACKDVLIKGCNITGVGNCPRNCVEEMVQIDIATPRTAPTVGKKFTKGQICKNVVIDKCKITGARAVCANYASKEKKYKSRFHENITVKNCILTGKSAEALALFNALKVKVINNKMKSNSKRTGEAYSIGCHLHIFGKISGIKDRTAVIKNNTAWGGRQAIQIYSHTSSKYSKATVTKNNAYCKKGKGNAIKIGGVKKSSVSGNKTYSW